MNDFPVDQNHDDSSAADNCYPTPTSNTPQPYLSSQALSQEMTSYVNSHCAYTGWTFPEEDSGEPPTVEPRPLRTDGQSSFEPQHTDDFWPSTLDSTTSVDSSKYELNSNKITEHEIWDLPPSTELTNYERNQDLSSFIQHPSNKYNLKTSTAENSTGRKFIATRANSASDVDHIRSQSSSSAESQALPKRRYSSTGEQYKAVTTQITNPEANIGSVDRESEAKLLARSLHSVVERKYRDNINMKITQLDQTLLDTHRPNGQPGNPEADDHPQKTSKADVLNGAVKYIQQAELESEARIKEIDFLRQRVAALEKLVNCGDCVILKQMSGQQISSATDF